MTEIMLSYNARVLSRTLRTRL